MAWQILSRRTMIVLGAALGWSTFGAGCILETDGSGGTGAGAGSAGGGNQGGSGAGAPADPSQLFVVNNNAELTSYVGAKGLDGELAPTTRLSLGATTSLFQPRAAVLTTSGRLLVARQNGGLVGYDTGLTADGDTPASVVVEGLDTPVALAYGASDDSLYVGGPQMEAGVVFFSGVSESTFDGVVAPDRVFGPPDRAPYTEMGTILLSVDALVKDGVGRLFVTDTSGANVNNSRVLVYDAPEAASGAAEPDAVITSVAWGTIEDMAIDAEGTLFVVNASQTVFVYEAAAELEGEVQPTRTIEVNLSGASLTGVLVSPAGLGYLTDNANHAVYSLDAIAAANGALLPSRTLEGFETRLRNPRKMFLVTP